MHDIGVLAPVAMNLSTTDEGFVEFFSDIEDSLVVDPVSADAVGVHVRLLGHILRYEFIKTIIPLRIHDVLHKTTPLRRDSKTTPPKARMLSALQPADGVHQLTCSPSRK
jgi:hypothetical protein